MLDPSLANLVKGEITTAMSTPTMLRYDTVPLVLPGNVVLNIGKRSRMLSFTTNM